MALVKPSRTNDPPRTMAEVLQVATAEFAVKGLSGARIHEIAATTRASKRMVHCCCCGSKEGRCVAVLEESYRRMRSIEAQLHLQDLPPEDALRRLVASPLATMPATRAASGCRRPSSCWRKR
jgi:AcrR family transcriptional regulator